MLLFPHYARKTYERDITAGKYKKEELLHLIVEEISYIEESLLNFKKENRLFATDLYYIDPLLEKIGKMKTHFKEILEKCVSFEQEQCAKKKEEAHRRIEDIEHSIDSALHHFVHQKDFFTKLKEEIFYLKTTFRVAYTVCALEGIGE